jgi:hypothetical protein
MSAQTSYLIKQPKAYAGLVYAQAPHDIVSRDVETVAGIGFGVAVSRGTNLERQIVAGGTTFTGITIRSLDKEGATNTGAIKWNEKEAAGILRDGYIWAVCPTGCNPGDAVKYTNATGVIDSGAAGVGETALDGAQWDTVTAAGELAVIRLNSLNTTAGS